jgi:hypothetical protein
VRTLDCEEVMVNRVLQRGRDLSLSEVEAELIDMSGKLWWMVDKLCYVSSSLKYLLSDAVMDGRTRVSIEYMEGRGP